MSTALIVVDVQKDFCEGGALAVAGGNKTAERIADYIEALGGLYQEIVFTKDAHIAWPDTNGGHFSDNPDFVDTWPEHCVIGDEGAKFHPVINNVCSLLTHFRDEFTRTDNIFYKGTGRPDYSGFQGRNGYGEGLSYYLSKRNILNVDVVGIAGDYCVKHTALDAKRQGFMTNILPTLVASVNGEDGTQEALYALANQS